MPTFFFFFLLLLFWAPLQLSCTNSIVGRRILHEPYLPLGSVPPSQPPSPSPPSSPTTPKYPFSTSTPNQSQFFPSYPPPPPPPSPATFASFPANISSLILPQSPSSKHTSSKLVAVSAAAAVSAVVFVGAAVFFHFRRRGFAEDKTLRSDNSSRLFPENAEEGNGTITVAASSSEFLYLGTLVNSRGIDDSCVNANVGNGDGGDGGDLDTRNLSSPELHPLPPLTRQNSMVVGGNEETEEEEEFYSPRVSLSVTGSGSRCLFLAEEKKCSDSSSCSYPSSTSGSPARSHSISLSPPVSLSPRRLQPNSAQPQAPDASPRPSNDANSSKNVVYSSSAFSTPERAVDRNPDASLGAWNQQVRSTTFPLDNHQDASPRKSNVSDQISPTSRILDLALSPNASDRNLRQSPTPSLPSSSQSPPSSPKRKLEGNSPTRSCLEESPERTLSATSQLHCIPSPLPSRILDLPSSPNDSDRSNMQSPTTSLPSLSPSPPSSPERNLEGNKPARSWLEKSPERTHSASLQPNCIPSPPPSRILDSALSANALDRDDQQSSTLLLPSPSPSPPSSPEPNLEENTTKRSWLEESPERTLSDSLQPHLIPSPPPSSILDLALSLNASDRHHWQSPTTSLPSSSPSLPSSPERNLEENTPARSWLEKSPERTLSDSLQQNRIPSPPPSRILDLASSPNALDRDHRQSPTPSLLSSSPSPPSSPERNLEEDKPTRSWLQKSPERTVSDSLQQNRFPSPPPSRVLDLASSPIALDRDHRQSPTPPLLSSSPSPPSSPERNLEEDTPTRSWLEKSPERTLSDSLQQNPTPSPPPPRILDLASSPNASDEGHRRSPTPSLPSSSPSPPSSPERNLEENTPRRSCLEKPPERTLSASSQPRRISSPPPSRTLDLASSPNASDGDHRQSPTPALLSLSPSPPSSPERDLEDTPRRSCLEKSPERTLCASSQRHRSPSPLPLRILDLSSSPSASDQNHRQSPAPSLPSSSPSPPSSPERNLEENTPTRSCLEKSPERTNSASSQPHCIPPPPPPPPPPLPMHGHWETPDPSTPIAHSKPISQPPALIPPSRPFVLQNPTQVSPIELPPSSTSTEKSEETPKPKLKPLHWDKVRASSDREMVWDHLRSSSFKLNEEMIETLFVVSTPNPKPKETTPRSVLPSPNHDNRVLDPKKSQNIAISLRALNVTTEEVCDALLEGNAETLGSEILESLLKMAPTKEEEWKLKEYKDDDSAIKFGPAEKFLKALLDVPFAFKRVVAMLYIANFESEIEYLKKSFGTLEAACEELRNCRMFLKLLDAVLKTGNRMNIGTNRGDAHAFKLDTLLKLVDVKGSDGKTTLLHFVVQEVIRTEGARLSGTNQTPNSTLSEDAKCRKLGLQVVSGLSSELTNVKKAAAMDSDVLSSEVSKLSRGIGNIGEVVRLNETTGLNESSQKFSESMNKFMQMAEEEIIRIQAQESVALSLVKEITEYFHGNSAKEEAHPFRIFLVVRDFLTILDRVCKEVGMINERTIVSSAHKFPVPVNPMLPQVIPPRRQYNSSDDETACP
ncbi:formin-like protein 1 [Carya illinoinensis]|uniref:Formin-like protein n=1 Tax=Carya illinoinensis TaxID=32201 RepID=A0A8T1NIG5_CARIL|nr:formin-like protein 1 [Carya illinoinensis]KAG6628894.1 hypothetical protein CIPAW_14G044500 [Carya illinoinensis]KAG6677846.1 hypothetical protein I3842_14G047500 [Carya illinoinensis]